MTVSVLFCGVGGQGVLTAAEACSVAAVLAGYHVKKSEVHGMAQRGGSVVSHVRFGERVFSPLIPLGSAQVLACFDPGEGERMAFYLAPDGISLLPHLRSFLETRTGGERRFLNSYLLGVASRYLPVGEESWLAAIERVFTRSAEANRAAFLAGRGR